MKYIDQSAKTLRLNLMTKEYNQTKLTILSKKIAKIKDHTIEYGILGESHYFKLFNDKFFFSEILACIDMEAEGISLNVNKIKEKNDNFEYTFTKETLDWNTDSKEKYIRFETHFTDILEFPTKEKYNFKPLTALILTKSNHDKEIVFESMHAYPNENKLVFSKSIIKLN